MVSRRWRLAGGYLIGIRLLSKLKTTVVSAVARNKNIANIEPIVLEIALVLTARCPSPFKNNLCPCLAVVTAAASPGIQ